MKVAVIGAGPGGLVVLKYLVKAHESLGTKAIQVRLFEAGSQVGGTFRERSYEDAEVCTVLSHKRLPIIDNHHVASLVKVSDHVLRFSPLQRNS